MIYVLLFLQRKFLPKYFSANRNNPKSKKNIFVIVFYISKNCMDSSKRMRKHLSVTILKRVIYVPLFNANQRRSMPILVVHSFCALGIRFIYCFIKFDNFFGRNAFTAQILKKYHRSACARIGGWSSWG